MVFHALKHVVILVGKLITIVMMLTTIVDVTGMEGTVVDLTEGYRISIVQLVNVWDSSMMVTIFLVFIMEVVMIQKWLQSLLVK